MIDGSRHGRRDVLLGVGVAVAVAALTLSGMAQAQTARELRPVTMQTDWGFNGPNSGFAVAKEKGFFAEEGLDVTINEGKGSGNTAQIVGSKAAQFGFSDGYVVANSISKGIDIKMVAAIFRRNPAAAIVLERSDIKSPKDLEGKRVGIPTGSAQFQQWPAFVKGCGLDGSKVRVVNVDPAGAPPALLSGQVEAIAGFAQGWTPAIELRGNEKARMFWYADCGVSTISNGIIVHNDLIKESPELIAPFVRASLKGFLYARQNPSEAAQIIKEYQQSADPAMTTREMELSWSTWVTPTTAGKPLGWMPEEDWKSTVDILKTYGGVTTDLDPASMYTNEYVPDGAEYVPPQSQP